MSQNSGIPHRYLRCKNCAHCLRNRSPPDNLPVNMRSCPSVFHLETLFHSNIRNCISTLHAALPDIEHGTDMILVYRILKPAHVYDIRHVQKHCEPVQNALSEPSDFQVLPASEGNCPPHLHNPYLRLQYVR